MTRHRNEAERWLRQAEYDQRAAQLNHDNGFYAWACFLSQQAAEKALKAFLYDLGEGPVIGHSTYKLAERCAAHNPQFTDLLSTARQLDRYYIPTRYPNGLPGGIPHEMYGESDSEAAMESLKLILALVQHLFSAGGQADEHSSTR